MHRDDGVVLTIQNQRPRRWHAIVILTLVATFFAGVCGGLGAPMSMVVEVLWSLGTLLSLVGALVLAAFVRHPTPSFRLTNIVQAPPGGPVYSPELIDRIEFASDPAEDYAEGRIPERLCEIRIYPQHRDCFHLIATVTDALWVCQWAEQRRIAIVETDGVKVTSLKGHSDSSPVCRTDSD
jgi:hypothetical protein